MEQILIAAAVLGVLCLQALQLVLIFKLQMDLEKFGRLLRKARRAIKADDGER